MSDRILVVDDSLTVRMDLMATLEGAGLDATACANIAEARAALATEPYALIILDVLLPDGDGIDLLSEIRARSDIGRTPVMLLSTEAEVADRIRGIQTGADEYVGKPYDSSFLIARARELIQGRPGAHDDAQTILVIDDSLTFRQALKERLEESAAYHVLLAVSGEEGLRVAAEQRPSAIIVDGELPGIDGPTVIRRLRLDAALRSTVCVLLTGSEDTGAELRALDAGADAFVHKGNEPGIVHARITAALRSANSHFTQRRARSLLAPKRLLIASENETDARTLAGSLRAAGYETALAHSGEQALELLAVQSVDCILLDLFLPRLGGEEVCRRVKGAPGMRDIPIIVLAEREDREAMIGGLAAGADDFIILSRDFDVLHARIVAQLRRRQFEDENRAVRDELLRRELDAAEDRTARKVAEARAALVEELERKNRELEAFSYSVSHDLRAPLRSIDGFSQALLEDYGDSLTGPAQDYLRRVRAAAQRMGELIDDLLQLSQVGRAPLRRQHVDLSAVAASVIAMLQRAEPDRRVKVTIEDGLVAEGDSGLLQALLENLLGNAWKFSAKSDPAKIEFIAERDGESCVYAIRDNGAGFDMAFADRLFAPFQRLHTVAEFPGTGIGLATVYRIVDRHGGRVWAEAEVGKGAAFRWTLGKRPGGDIA